MTPEDLLRAYDTNAQKRELSLSFKSLSTDKQIVTGEVYAPYIIDSHGEMMKAEDVELLAHRFLGTLKNHQIDLMHNNEVLKATVVESFIARDDDPTYNPGAWVMSVKFNDQEFFDKIKRGDYSGYSFEALVTKYDAIVEIDVEPHVFGETELNLDHTHYFFVEVDDNGRVKGGTTSPAEDGHVHVIRFGTATEDSDEGEVHSHRYFLQ